jgi:predicted aspartyl protease
MGLAQATIRLSSPRRAQIEPLEADALADTGTLHLVVPEHVRIQLELEETERREVVLADGSRRLVPYVGPIDYVSRTE